MPPDLYSTLLPQQPPEPRNARTVKFKGGEQGVYEPDPLERARREREYAARRAKRTAAQRNGPRT